MFGGDTRDGKIPAGVGGWQKWGVGVKIIDGVVKLGGDFETQRHRGTERGRRDIRIRD
jgi:hypothetical protein